MTSTLAIGTTTSSASDSTVYTEVVRNQTTVPKNNGISTEPQFNTFEQREESTEIKLAKACAMIEQLKREVRDLSSENDDLVNDIHDVIAENDELKKDLRERTREVVDLKGRLTKATNECDKMCDQMERCKSYRSDEQNFLDPLEVEQLIQKMRSQVKRKIREAEAEKDRYQNTLAEIELERDEIQHTLVTSKIKVEREMLQIKEELQSLKYYAGKMRLENQRLHFKLLRYQQQNEHVHEQRRLRRRHSVGGKPELVLSCDDEARKRIENLENLLQKAVSESRELRHVLELVRQKHERTQAAQANLDEEIRGLKYYAGRLTLEKKALQEKISHAAIKVSSPENGRLQQLWKGRSGRPTQELVAHQSCDDERIAEVLKELRALKVYAGKLHLENRRLKNQIDSDASP